MTEPSSREKFYTTVRVRWSMLLLILLWLLMSHSRDDLLVRSISAVVVVLVANFVPRFIVARDEIRMSRFHRLRWDNVRSAELLTYFGRRYLSVHPIRGKRWVIPLNLNNGRSLEEVLLLQSPRGNPIHNALAPLPDGSGPVTRAGRTPWRRIFVALGVWLAALATAAWIAIQLTTRSITEMDLIPTPLATGSAQPPVELTELTAYDMTMSIPCSIKGEPTRDRKFTAVYCTNGNGILIGNPNEPVALPWLGDSKMSHEAHDYLVKAAGVTEPQALMKTWLSLTRSDLSWFNAPWTTQILLYLLYTKSSRAMNHSNLYELTGDVHGFQFGSPEDDCRVEVILNDPNMGLLRLYFSTHSNDQPLTQSDIFAVAASLHSTPATKLRH